MAQSQHMLTLFFVVNFSVVCQPSAKSADTFLRFFCCLPTLTIFAMQISRQTYLRLKGVNPPDMTHHIFTLLLYASSIKKSINITSNILQFLVIFFSCKLAHSTTLQKAAVIKPMRKKEIIYLFIMVYH